MLARGHPVSSVHTSAHTHAGAHSHTHTLTRSACTHARARSRTHAHTHTHAHTLTHSRTHACTHARTHAHNHAHTHSARTPARTWAPRCRGHHRGVTLPRSACSERRGLGGFRHVLARSTGAVVAARCHPTGGRRLVFAGARCNPPGELGHSGVHCKPPGELGAQRGALQHPWAPTTPAGPRSRAQPHSHPAASSRPLPEGWVLPPCGQQAVHTTAKMLSLQGLRGAGPAACPRPGWPVSTASLGLMSDTAQPLQWQGHPDPKSPGSQSHPKFWATQPRVRSQGP